MLRALLDGADVTDAEHALSLRDRGLHYGDGLFETMLLRDSVRLLDRHLARLRAGCERLGIPAPSVATLRDDVAKVTQGHRQGVVKLLVTRGVGTRGYRADSGAPRRLALLYPPSAEGAPEIQMRWCETRLARNPQLAGIKHLNRLEQVLAWQEWRDPAIDPAIDEGLMLDTENEVVCGTMSNLFIVSDGVLATPDLRFSGVRGVLREWVLVAASQLGIEAKECALRMDDVLNASEVFVTNAVRGIRPVIALADRRWPVGAIAQRLLTALEQVR